MSRPVNLRDYERKKAESELWERKYIEMSKENFVLKQEILNLYKIVDVEVAKENVKLKDRVSKLEKVLGFLELLDPISCEHFHHDKKDYHKKQPCPIETRFRQAIVDCEASE
jgi:hypothetical protein